MAENEMYFLERQETVTDLKRGLDWEEEEEWSWSASLVMHP